MGLTAVEIDRHIAHWEGVLAKTRPDYRATWPSRLFHHAALENAASILISGQLLSRDDAHAYGFTDVASQAVVNTNTHAHRFGRMYFRPRTPTQFHIEDVRKVEEYYNNEASAHAPMLFMFVFSAKAVLLMPHTQFSIGNMQSTGTRFGPTSEDFGQIDFEKVFHEGPFSTDDGPITFCRCAEVLAPSPLPIKDQLQAIICRTRAERQTLIYRIGEAATKRWAPLMRVSDDMRLFERKFRYVEEVSISPAGVIFRIHGRHAAELVAVGVTAVRVSTGKIAIDFNDPQLRATPPDGGRWRVKGAGTLQPGAYHVQILLEGHLAFEAEMWIESEPF